MHYRKYVQDPNHKMARAFLDNETYAKAMEAFVIVCADAVICDPERRTFFLAKRRAKPAKNWWFMGGRMLAGEDKAEAIRRAFERETKLALDADRFRHILIYEIRWPDRQQVPQDKGCHMLSFLHTVELTEDERRKAAQNLDVNEYDGSFGLQEFDRDRIGRELPYNKMFLEFHDLAFPEAEM